MKKLFLILTTFISLLDNITAQTTLEEGPPVECGSNVPQKILGKNEKYFFVLRTNLKSSDKKYHIEKYAIADMSFVSAIDISLENNIEAKSSVIKTFGGNDLIELKDVFYLNGKFLVFRTSTDHKKGSITLFLQTISEDGNINKDLSELYKIKITPLPNMSINYDALDCNYAEFSFSLSSDNKKLLVIDQEIRNNHGTESIEKISTKLLDAETMTFKMEKEIPNQYKETKIRPWDYKVDGSENIYFIYNYFNSDKKLQTAIGLVAPNSSSIIGMDINVDRTKYKIEDVDYLINDNSIYCNGIYKNKTDKKEKGSNNQIELFSVFSQKFNTNSYKTEQSDSKPLSEDIIHKLKISVHQGFDINHGYQNFKLDHINIINNEVYSIAQLYIPYSALLVFKTNILGKIEWMTSINNSFGPYSRKAVSAYLDLNSCYYHVCTSNDKLSIIFNENPKNLKKIKNKNVYDLELAEYKIYSRIKGTNVIFANIDKSGVVERDVIFKNEKYCLLFLPKVMWHNFMPFSMTNNLILPLTDNQILVYLKDDKGKSLFRNGKNDKFGKIFIK